MQPRRGGAKDKAHYLVGKRGGRERRQNGKKTRYFVVLNNECSQMDISIGTTATKNQPHHLSAFCHQFDTLVLSMRPTITTTIFPNLNNR